MRARSQELSELLADVLEALGAVPESRAREVASTLTFAASPRATTLVAEARTGAVGLLVATDEPNESRVFVHWVAVVAERRRAGIASELVDRLEEIHPTATIYGSVDQQDATAMDFWRERGWTPLRPPPRRILMGSTAPEG